MELHELMGELVKGVVRPIYIFTGDEVGIMDIYIKKIGEVAGVTPKRVDSLSSIFSRLRNQSFGAQKSCYVIRDDKEYLSQEKVWDDVNTGKAQGNNVIILIYTSLDKRGKFFKQHEPSLTVFERLLPEVLCKYIKKEIGLDVNNGIKLAELCDCDYSRILLECNKLEHLAKANNYDITTAFNEAIKHNLIYTSPKDKVFEFVDAVCRRQTKIAFRLYEELKSVTDSPLGALSLLYTNMRAMLLVQSLGNESSPAEKTGLTPWQVKLAKEKGTKYSIGELVANIRTIRDAEKGIKTGNLEADVAMDYVMVNIL